ncbi:MAG: hypothetical protein ACUZ8H_01485 [Candidatus Anammoxibacter sp.]
MKTILTEVQYLNGVTLKEFTKHLLWVVKIMKSASFKLEDFKTPKDKKQ